MTSVSRARGRPGVSARSRPPHGLRGRLVAASAIAALAASGLSAGAATAAPTDGAASATKPGPSAHGKLGSKDASLLSAATARGDRTITLIVAARPGATKQAAAVFTKHGGSVGKRIDKLGYVRVTLPTGKARQAVSAADDVSAVRSMDLNETVKLPDPSPNPDKTKADETEAAGHGELPQPGAPYLAKDPHAAKHAAQAEKRVEKRRDARTDAASDNANSAKKAQAPDKHTGANNPYMPVNETGATSFVKKHPKWDGRGVTVGILDSGVDLDSPALQKTSTGKRKIVDWNTATDPVVDGDGTWLPMRSKVTGPTFTHDGVTYQAPKGSYYVNVFKESVTSGGEMLGDLNRDGDTKDSWAVLYDPSSGEVRVDLNNNHDFTDDEAMLPYDKKHQVGHFGADDPKTPIAESIPFTVESRKDVDLSPAGKKWEGKTADFVNIGVVEAAHGTHVAGITAGNKLFGGKMTGAAPGAQVVSSRACTWGGGCTTVALTEGLIDLAANRGADVVNISIGGLPALNDGHNARAELYNRVIKRYHTQLAISAGNEGPGMNTVGDPGVVDDVLSVGASVSKETWAADYGSQVAAKQALFPFSSRGPREDGGFKPTITAPGAAISSVPTWQPGQPVPEAGYDLPPGYAMFNGTSMAAPQTTGGVALLLSAAKAQHVDATPAKLRRAINSSGHTYQDQQSYEQGNGLLNIPGAWKKLHAKDAATGGYTVKAPVTSELSQYLEEPNHGAGIYDRGRPDEKGPKAGKAKTYPVTITRTSGRRGLVAHRLRWSGGDSTFSAPKTVALPLNKPVTVKVTGKPSKAGAHSAILNIDDPATTGVDHQMLATVVVPEQPKAPSWATSSSGRVDRNQSAGQFVYVPEGAKALQVSLSNLQGGKTSYFLSDPRGIPTVDIDPDNPKTTQVKNPTPGVWHIGVSASRTSKLLSNPYTLRSTVLGVDFDPETSTIEHPKAGESTQVTWQAKNTHAPVQGKFTGGELGSAKRARPSIAEGKTKETTVRVPEGASRAVFSVGNTSDKQADLDMTVLRDGKEVDTSAEGGSDESVTLKKPEPGTYTVRVEAYAVPDGTTKYDYQDVYRAPSLGSVKTDDDTVTLDNGKSTSVSATVTPKSGPGEGRELFGEVSLVNEAGSVAGTGRVVIKKLES